MDKETRSRTIAPAQSSSMLSVTTAASAPNAEAATSAAAAWYTVGLLTAVYTLNYMDRMALSVLLPHIQRDLALSDSQLGLLSGLAFFLFYALCGIPVARLADRGNRRNIIVAGITLWSIMTAASGATQNFWHMLIARFGLGASEAGCVPASSSILADYVSPERRPLVFSIFGLGPFLGTMIGMAAAGQLAETFGWRWAFALLGLPGLLLAAIVLFTLREPRRGMSEAATDVAPIRLNAAVRQLWRTKTFRALALAYIFTSFIQSAFLQWWPTFYSRTGDLSLAEVGLSLGGALGLGAASGVLIGGIIAQRLSATDMGAPLRLFAIGSWIAALTACSSLFAPSFAASMALVFATNFLWSAPAGALMSANANINAPNTRALASGLLTFLLALFGFALGPLLVGVASDIIALRVEGNSLRWALIVPLCFVPLQFLTMRNVGVSLDADVRRRLGAT